MVTHPARSALQTWRSALQLLFTRRFGTFWFASLLSSIGTWAQQTAEPWLLLALGASPFLIGLDAFAMNAPTWALTLVGGRLADRRDRRHVIALFQSIQMLCPAIIVVLLLMGKITPWIIIALSVVVGVTDALSMPAFQSIVPTIVPRAQLDRGIALNTAQFSLSRILGPAVAGVLLASVGAVACFAVSAASYVPFIAIALWILPPRARVVTPAAADAAPSTTWSAVRTIWQQPQIRGALLTVFVSALLTSPLITFTPVLVHASFDGDATTFSVAMTAFGAGGLVGAIALLAISSTVDRRHLSAAAGILCAATLIATALTPWRWLLPILLATAGATMTICHASANVVLQATALPHALGQTVSLYLLAMRGGMSLGALATGVTVGWLGVRYALLLNGALAVAGQLTVALWWLRRGAATQVTEHAPSP